MAWNVSFSFCAFTIKMALVLLYKRVFIQRRFQIACWISIAYLAACSITTLLQSLLQCIPLKAAWDFTIQATCVSEATNFYSSSALILSTDLLVLALPVPVVWQLQTTIARKLQLSALFAIGTL